MPTPPITPTLTLTPPPLTSTPTPTPAQVEDETATLALSLTADPPWAAPGEVVTFTVTAASPALAAAVTAAALLAIVSPRNNETWATTEQGGWLRSADDRLLLRVPPGAVKGRAHFRYAPAGDLAQPLAGLRHAFTVEAQAEDGTTQHEFAAPLELSLAYRATEYPAGAGTPALYYFDEASRRWTRLPTVVDRARRQTPASGARKSSRS